MSHPFLAKLKENRNLEIPAPGRFAPASVKDVANCLDVPDRLFTARSIPDIWARPLLFHQVLIGGAESSRTQSEQQRVAREEWVGFMALLALRRLRGLRIDFQAVFETEYHNTFLAVAERLRPDALVQDSLFARDTWRHISIIRLDCQVIGITSPLTLICPAPDYGRVLSKANIDWFYDGRLQDPLPHLSASEKGGFRLWLKNLQLAAKDAVANPSSTRWASFNKFFDAVLRTLPDEHGSTFAVTNDAAGIAGFALAHLGGALMSDDTHSFSSDVVLQGTRGAPPSKAAYILDAAIAGVKRINEVKVLPSVNLLFALRSLDRQKKDKIGENTIPDGYWYTVEDIFTPKLFLAPWRLRPGNAGEDEVDSLPGGLSASGIAQLRWGGKKRVSALLPIQEHWLSWYPAEELAKRCRFREDSDGIAVTLRLTLSGGDVELTRKYAKSDIIPVTNLPLIRIWPFLAPQDWKAFYTYQDGYDEADLYARPFLHSTTVAPTRVAIHDGRKDRYFEITPTAQYPEAVVFTMGRDNAGILPLVQPPSIARSAGEARVGIDFGTTGTTIYFAESSGEPAPLTFQPRTKEITAVEEKFAANQFRRFLPPQAEDGGTLLSVFQDLNPGRNNLSEIEPIREGRVRFISADAVGFYSAAEAGLYTNMKWGPPEAQVRPRAFLGQLALMISAEVAAKRIPRISWRFSFPTSFTESAQAGARDCFKSVVEYASRQTGIAAVMEGGLQKKLYKHKNESVATAHYFYQTQFAPLSRGAVFVDIGGGTTDVAIWQSAPDQPETAIVSQVSIPFAGRDLFLEPLRQNPAFLSLFGIDTRPLEDIKGKKEAFYSQVDALLKRAQGDQLLDRLSDFREVEAFKGMQTILQLGLAGILHYIGLMLQALADGPNPKWQKMLPPVFVGGNGCKILHWCSGGTYDPASDIDRKLRRALFLGTRFTKISDDDNALEISLSSAPKTEVAHGLLIDALRESESNKTHKLELLEDEEDNRPRVMAGDSFSLNGRQVPWNEFLPHDLDLRAARLDAKPPALATVMKLVGLEESLLPKVSRRAEARIQADHRPDKENKDRRVEPILITEVRAAVEQCAEEWAKSFVARR